MRSDNTTLISKEDLTALNISNEDLALTDTHIEHFLKAQHSLGKILYFDQHGLKKFIFVQPQSLVNILRSFITDELFWPQEKGLRDILLTMINTGEIAKKIYSNFGHMRNLISTCQTMNLKSLQYKSWFT
jgi:hypothetical protein